MRGNNFGATASAFLALPAGLVEEDGGGGTDIEGINFVGHGDENGFVAGGEDGFGDAIAFAAEDDAAIAGEIGLGEGFPVSVGMRGDAADVVGAEGLEGFNQGLSLKDGNFEDGAHGIADRAAKPGAGTGFADDEGLNAEGDTIAHEQADVLGIGQAVHGGEQPGWLVLFEQIIERGFDGNPADGEDALEHLEADERFEEFFIGQIDGDVFRTFRKERLKFRQAGFGQDDGFYEERTFEETLDDFIAFGHEDALGGVFGGTAQGAIGGEFRRVERGDGGDAEHGGILNHRWTQINTDFGDKRFRVTSSVIRLAIDIPGP